MVSRVPGPVSRDSESVGQGRRSQQPERVVKQRPGGQCVTHVRVPGRHLGTALREGMSTGATLADAEMGHWLGERFPTAAFVSA